jgi:hypothetical protein
MFKRATERPPRSGLSEIQLPELHDYRFRVSAVGAFKYALVFTGLLGWINGHEKQRQPACGAATLANRRSFWNETTRNWHSGSPG